MVGVDKVLAEKELWAFQHRQLLTEREQCEMEEKAVREEIEEIVELKSPSSDSSTEVDALTKVMEKAVLLIRSKEVMLSKDEHCYTTADCSLDCTKLTDQSAVQILSAAASALWHDSSKLAVNRSSFTRSRRTQKKAKFADEI